MKILLDCTLLNFGGSVQVGLSILNNIERYSKHDWYLVLSKTLEKQIRKPFLERFKDYSVLSMETKLDRLKLFRKMPEIESKFKPDIVFTVFGPSYWRPKAIHLQGFAHPTIIYNPGLEFLKDRTLMSYFTDPLKRTLFKRSDYLMVETETVKKRLSEKLRLKKEKILVVGNSYSPIFKKSMGEKVRRIDPGKFEIIVPSSYYKHKNLESVPSVAKEMKGLAAEYFKFVFTLPKNDCAWKRIREKARTLGVETNLKTVGVIPHAEIYSLYRNANLVFLPTLLECSTAVYPESFMAGVPLATSNLDFAHDLCGNAALYFDPYSPKDMARKIILLMRNPSLRKKLIRNGQKQLKNKFPSPKEKWEKQLGFIEFVVNKRRK